MSKNNQDYDNENDDSQSYDDDNQDQEDQEYDSQDDNSQNNDENGDDDDDGDQDDADNGDDNDDENDDEDEEDDENGDGPKYIRLRGLPWSATHKEILGFLKNITVVGGAEGIHIITRRWDGKNTGEAYVEVKSKEDAAKALKLDNASMGHRYIEVFNASGKEAKEAMRKTSTHGISYVVKLRGLPYSITEQQIEDFFSGLEIKPDREGIIFVMDRRGRATGEAFVQFESQEDTEQALGRNRQKIGHRYIEIFRSSLAELKRSTGNGNGRMAPYDIKDRGSNRGAGNGSDYGGNNRNNRWGNNGGFGVGANNTLGFNNLSNFGNNGNFGNGNNGNFGNFGKTGGGMGNFGNFGNNGGGNFGNFGNNLGGGNNGGGGGSFNRFSSNSGNFGNDFGDFGNFGNDRGNNGMGGGNNNGNSNGSFNNFGNFGNGGGNNMGGGGGGSGFGNNMGGGGGGNFGPIGGGRNDDYYMIIMRGLPFSSFENDVMKFFEPLRPANARIHYNKQNGRHNGTAEAMFETYEDAQSAMKRHRSKMGTRYIELFLSGKANAKGGGNNYNSSGNMGSGNNGIGVGGGMGGAFSRRI